MKKVKLNKYSVDLKALAEVHSWIEVEGVSAEDALRKAKAILKDQLLPEVNFDSMNGGIHFNGWEIQEIFDVPLSQMSRAEYANKGVRITSVDLNQEAESEEQAKDCLSDDEGL